MTRASLTSLLTRPGWETVWALADVAGIQGEYREALELSNQTEAMSTGVGKVTRPAEFGLAPETLTETRLRA